MVIRWHMHRFVVWRNHVYYRTHPCCTTQARNNEVACPGIIRLAPSFVSNPLRTKKSATEESDKGGEMHHIRYSSGVGPGGGEALN